MARTVVVEVACDICGAGVPEGADSRFGYSGRSYSIDLCNDHAEELRVAVQPFVNAATPQSRRGTRSTPRPTSGRPARRDAAQTGAIRDWARAHGFSLSDRGRIPREVEDAYNSREE